MGRTGKWGYYGEWECEEFTIKTIKKVYISQSNKNIQGPRWAPFVSNIIKLIKASLRVINVPRPRWAPFVGNITIIFLVNMNLAILCSYLQTSSIGAQSGVTETLAFYCFK